LIFLGGMRVLSFISLFGKEEILEIWHGHPLPLALHLMWLAIWFLLPIWILPIIVLFGWFGIGLSALLSIYALWRSASILRAYSGTALVVTTKRLIILSTKGWGKVKKDNVDLGDISTLSVSYPNVLARCFRYGTLAVHLKGEKDIWYILNVPRIKRTHLVIEAIQKTSSGSSLS